MEPHPLPDATRLSTAVFDIPAVLACANVITSCLAIAACTSFTVMQPWTPNQHGGFRGHPELVGKSPLCGGFPTNSAGTGCDELHVHDANASGRLRNVINPFPGTCTGLEVRKGQRCPTAR